MKSTLLKVLQEQRYNQDVTAISYLRRMVFFGAQAVCEKTHQPVPKMPVQVTVPSRNSDKTILSCLQLRLNYCLVFKGTQYCSESFLVHDSFFLLSAVKLHSVRNVFRSQSCWFENIVKTLTEVFASFSSTEVFHQIIWNSQILQASSSPCRLPPQIFSAFLLLLLLLLKEGTDGKIELTVLPLNGPLLPYFKNSHCGLEHTCIPLFQHTSGTPYYQIANLQHSVFWNTISSRGLSQYLVRQIC